MQPPSSGCQLAYMVLQTANDTNMIHVPWNLFPFFLALREGNVGLALQNTNLECTLDTLNNRFYNNSCFPSKIVQVQSFCKISTFCCWFLVFLSTSSKCSLRQPNPGQRLWRLAWFGPFPHWLHLSVKKNLATGLQKKNGCLYFLKEKMVY